jgi:hypothetical protein
MNIKYIMKRLSVKEQKTLRNNLLKLEEWDLRHIAHYLNRNNIKLSENASGIFILCDHISDECLIYLKTYVDKKLEEYKNFRHINHSN